MADFVHLHLHTEYSLLDGACRIGEMLDEVVRLRMPAVAVTEHGNLFSAIKFHDEARKRGVNPIIGCEVYVANGDRRNHSGTPGETANHLVLLASNLAGYHNLIKLVSAGYTEGFYYKPRIDKELLAAHADGIIGLSSCLKGEVATNLCRDRASAAREAAASFRDILGPDGFFLEMQYQGIEDQLVVNRGLPPIAADLGLPLVCTNDVHYLREGDDRPHDVLLCIGTGKNVADEKRLRYHGDQFYLKSPDQMAAVFGDHPEALRNTVAIAERCDVDLSGTVHRLPNFDVPSPFESPDDYFASVAREGFTDRLPRLKELRGRGVLRYDIEEYERRLSYEIEMIQKMGYAGYFLIVWDFIRYAREQGIPVGPGRGSAAGSLVAWCLQITDVDPMQFDLIFERFLNPERVSLPDIDIDFCERRRGEVIDYVTRKYGRDNVAQIITFGTMKARAVVRDVGRTMGMSYADVDRVAKQIPPTLNMTLEKALEESPDLRNAEQRDPQVKELVAVARRLEGITRHASVHAAGVVITPRPITEFAPVYKSQKEEITTQWAMKQVERMGLLKMDFLGLSTLTLLHDAVDHIRETTGESIALDRLPMDDEKTYRLFCDGQTLGIFQFESSGMRDTLRKAKPQRFDDLIALNALYRPGPLQGGVIDKFINRKHGREAIEYDAPALEPILQDTYGVIAYQEQVMRVASDLAGFTMGDADLLRKAMGKKDAAVMQAQRRKFIEGATAREVSAGQAALIFQFIEHFAGYGFNKSHSTAYALLAYQTAYLKANHPRHFMAALMTIEAQNTDKLALYLGECRDMGIPVLAPDLNASDKRFRVAPEGVRFGLTAVKNVGEGAIDAIIACRERHGRIESLFRLCEDVDLRLVNKRVFESLIKAGAFDSVLASGARRAPDGRAQLLAVLDRAFDHGNRVQRDRELGQAQLFDVVDAGGDPDGGARLPDVAPWTPSEQLAFEKESLGLYLGGHPIDGYRDQLEAAGARTVDALQNGDSTVFAGGIVSGYRPRTTRQGAPMAAFTLEDRTGSVEVVVFPKTWERCREAVDADRLVVVSGRLDRDGEVAQVVAEDVRPIESLSGAVGRTLSIRLSASRHGRETLQALADLFDLHRGPSWIRLHLELPGHRPPLRVQARLKEARIRPSVQLAEAVERICGEATVSWT